MSSFKIGDRVRIKDWPFEANGWTLNGRAATVMALPDGESEFFIRLRFDDPIGDDFLDEEDLHCLSTEIERVDG
jgi:hypothetical protein